MAGEPPRDIRVMAFRYPLIAWLFAAMLTSAVEAQPRGRIDLNGAWEFRLDPGNSGVEQRWFAEANAPFADRIQVPGTWQAQGFGEPSARLSHDYSGAGWYRRTIDVPETWRDKAVLLRIGGAHRITTVWVNGSEAGGYDGISSPFTFDISRFIRRGAKNTIVIRIENPAVTVEEDPERQKAKYPTGMLNYLGNWGGISAAVSLDAVPATHVESVLVLPDVERRQAAFRISMAGADASGVSVRVSVPSGSPVEQNLQGGKASLVLPLPNAPLWTPENPALLTAVIQLLRDGHEIDRYEQRFGLRQATTRGNMFLLNGKPYYLRGYGDDNIEVLTGFPASQKSVILERLKLAKSFGFNAVRFHSFVPPPEYFEAADEAGLLVMAELPAAYTQYFLPFRDYLRREMQQVLLSYRNHPSFLSLALGNELDLNWLKSDEERHELLASIAEFYKFAKELAPATLFLSTDGHDLRPTDMVSLGMWARPAADRPTLRHEFGEYYCSLPDVGLIDRFTGVIKPTWLEAKRDWIHSHGLEKRYPTYLENSRRLQQLGRKFQIERVRANSGITGYHYWLIVDFPGGTGEGDSWEEGWFDYFWQPKLRAEEGRKLNSPVLLLTEAAVDNRTLFAGERKTIRMRVSNYGDADIRNGRMSWALMDGARRISGSERDAVDAPLGSVSDIGDVVVDARGVRDARKLELIVSLEAAGQTSQNTWSFWTMPRPSTAAPEVPVVSAVRSAALRRLYPWMFDGESNLDARALLITNALDRHALAHLNRGGRVWLMLTDSPDRRGVSYFPAAGGALGTVVASGPALAGFPHEGFCDLQFYTLMHGAYPLPIDRWPGEFDPIIGGIRTTSAFLSKTKDLSRIAFAAEAKAAGGSLLITTLRLRENLDDAYPEAIAMFDSLLRYAAGPAFQPQQELSEAAWGRLVEE